MMRRKGTIAASMFAMAALAGCGEAYVTGGSEMSSQPVASDQWGQTTQNPMDAPQEWPAAQPAGARLEPTATPATPATPATQPATQPAAQQWQ